MENNFEKKKFHITTFGCQMNEHDSETMAGMLIAKGYEPARERKDANIVIFNTCSIRENADKRFFGTLGQLKKRKIEEGETKEHAIEREIKEELDMDIKCESEFDSHIFEYPNKTINLIVLNCTMIGDSYKALEHEDLK